MRAKAGERYGAFVAALSCQLANGPKLRQEISEDVDRVRGSDCADKTRAQRLEDGAGVLARCGFHQAAFFFSSAG